MVIQSVNPTGVPAATGAVLPTPSGDSPPSTAGTAAAASNPVTSGQAAPSAQVNGAVHTLNQSPFLNRDLTFSVDKTTHETVVKVVEARTGAVIAQIPSRQALSIAQAIDALPQHQGVLLNQKA
ncbi:MAG: flagellar biosynthesis protein FlaG [Ferrovum sp.]|jgi:flagellar protein FlaG|nr:flagellar biosynthesis protein FlaG [Ferrovum sp.]